MRVATVRRHDPVPRSIPGRAASSAGRHVPSVKPLGAVPGEPFFGAVPVIVSVAIVPDVAPAESVTRRPTRTVPELPYEPTALGEEPQSVSNDPLPSRSNAYEMIEPSVSD